MERSMLVRGLSRDTVIDTAFQLLAGGGSRGASMKDIAEILGVRAPSLYNHVLSKQDILFAIMDKAMDRALDAQEEALAGVGDVAAQLRAGAESLVLDFLRFPAEVTVCNTEVRSLDPANRAAIVAKRDRYASRVRAIIAAGCPGRPVRDREPGSGRLRRPGDGQRRQILVPPQRPLPGHICRSRVRRVRPPHGRQHRLTAGPELRM